MFDAHCHLQLAPNHVRHPTRHLYTAHRASQPIQHGTRYAVNGTNPDDWDAVLNLAHRHPGVVFPSLGCHPWHTHRWVPALQDQLQNLLRDHPHAGVGESGLDAPHAQRQPHPATSMAQQRTALDAHIALASSLTRPLSLHCVRAHGPLLDALTTAPLDKPLTAVVHSYTGAPDNTARLLHLSAASRAVEVYFSLHGARIAQLAPARQRAYVAAVPMDRLLVETDADGGCCMTLQDTCALLAALLPGCTAEDVAVMSTCNAARVFCLGGD